MEGSDASFHSSELFDCTSFSFGPGAWASRVSFFFFSRGHVSLTVSFSNNETHVFSANHSPPVFLEKLSLFFSVKTGGAISLDSTSFSEMNRTEIQDHVYEGDGRSPNRGRGRVLEQPYHPCVIEDPQEFHDSQCFRSDGDILEYLNNLTERFKYWRDVRLFPESRAAKTCMWRAEVLKNILNRRGVTTPDLYDEVFGFQPIKKQRVTLDTQAEIRAAEQQLKEAKARHARAIAARPTSPLSTETEDQTALDAIKVAYEEEELVDTESG